MLMLCWIFILHFIADFLCQPRWMGKQKSEQPAILVLHTLIIMVVMLIGLSPFVGALPGVAFAAANAAAHGVTDLFSWTGYKWYVKRKIIALQRANGNDDSEEEIMTDFLKAQKLSPYPYWEDHWFFVTIGFDQLLHGLALIILASTVL